MKLHEEFKLYETMWDEVPSNSSTENRYIILTGDFPNKYYVHGLTSDGEKEAVDIYNKAMSQLPNFDCDIEVAELFDLTGDEISRLESMVGKEVTGADADFIADFFVDGSRVDSLQNNFNEVDTLHEFVYVNGNKTTTTVNSTSSNKPSVDSLGRFDHTPRFKSLLAQIDADKLATYEVRNLGTRLLYIIITSVDFGYRTSVRIIGPFRQDGKEYTLQLGLNSANHGDHHNLSWKELLDYLIDESIIENTNLCN